jgi:glycosyltransferase involved in cell wall biosynthesis
LSHQRLAVLHVAPTLGIGGAETMLLALVKYLVGQGVANHVLVLGADLTLRAEFEKVGASVKCLGWSRRRIPTGRDLVELRSAVRAINPTVIQGWMYHANLAALVARLLATRVPIVWSVHHSLYALRDEPPLTRWVIRLCRLTSSLVRRVIFVSNTSRRQHLEFGFARENSEVIPNGVALETVRTALDTRSTLRSELGIPHDAFVIGCIARAHPMKDHINMVRAAERVMRVEERCWLLMVGADVDRRDTDLGREIARSGERSRIVVQGARRDIPAVLAAIDVACSSSAWGESLPMIMLEAMAAGVPCVATDLGDCATIIGDASRVVSPRDPAALAEALLRVVRMGASEYAALSAGVRQRVEASYSLSSVASAYLRVYRDCIG